jgi:hypothetical protein
MMRDGFEQSNHIIAQQQHSFISHTNKHTHKYMYTHTHHFAYLAIMCHINIAVALCASSRDTLKMHTTSANKLVTH